MQLLQFYWSTRLLKLVKSKNQQKFVNILLQIY